MDLPAPDGPVSASRWPAATLIDTSCSAGAFAGVLEADVLELELALGAAAAVGVRAVLDHVVLGEHLGDPVGAGERGGELRRLAGEQRIGEDALRV